MNGKMRISAETSVVDEEQRDYLRVNKLARARCVRGGREQGQEKVAAGRVRCEKFEVHEQHPTGAAHVRPRSSSTQVLCSYRFISLIYCTYTFDFPEQKLIQKLFNLCKTINYY